MIIYNITVKTDWSIYEEWLKWMKEERLPAMMNTGLFVDHRVMRLLETDESDGPTFAVQYFAASMQDYNVYLSEYQDANNQQEFIKWGNRMVQFSTVMEVLM